MTIQISENDPRVVYTVGEGVEQTVFTVPFEWYDDAELNVYVDGVQKSEGTDWTVTTGGDGTAGSITFNAADPGETQVVTGATGGSIVVIFRRLVVERSADFSPGSAISRPALNAQLDKLHAMIADLNDKVDRALHLADKDEAESSYVLPDSADLKGRYLMFDATTGLPALGYSANEIASAISGNAVNEIFYLGPATSDPSTDLQGNALVAGKSFYYNISSEELKIYGSSGWVTIPSTAFTQTTADALYAAISHTHAQSDVTGLVSALAAKASLTGTETLTNKTIDDIILTGKVRGERSDVTWSGTADLDPDKMIQRVTLSADVTLTDDMSDGDSVLYFILGTAFEVTWPGPVWLSDFGVAPTLQASGATAVAIQKVGTTLYASALNGA